MKGIQWALVPLLAGTAAAEPLPSPGIAFEAAEALFQRDPRWLGTDGADSTLLSDGRIFWTFEDTLVAVSEKRDRGASEMVRNSIAIQAGRDPLTAEIQFFWSEDESGHPSAFFPGDGQAWYWTGGALHLDQGPLVTFLFRQVATPGEGLGFGNEGFAVAITDNPLDDPPSWRTRFVRGPVTRLDAVPATDLAMVDGFVVGLALRQRGEHAGALVRYRAEELVQGDIDNPEWWLGADRGWVRQSLLDDGEPAWVIPDAGNEATIHWDAHREEWLHVASYGFGSARIGIRTAPAVTGPWSEPQMVYDPPENRDPGVHVYSALAHPELAVASPDELLVTYATNAVNFEDLFTPQGSQRLYWPRVIRVRPGKR